MTGGLIQLAQYGSQDIFLSGNPQITYFKTVYRRYTNFALETFTLPFHTPIGFNKVATVKFPYRGDLLYKIKLELIMNETNIPRIPDQSEKTIAKINLDKAKEYYNRSRAYFTLNTGANIEAMKILNADNGSIEKVKTAITAYYINNPEYVYSSGSTALDFTKLIQNDKKPPTKLIDGTPTILNFKESDLHIGYLIESYSGSSKIELKKILKGCLCACDNLHEYYFNFKNGTNDSDGVLPLQEIYDDISSVRRKFAWVKNLGTSIVDNVSIAIGGLTIDRLYGEWLNIWYELTISNEKKKIYDKMVGNVPEMTEFTRDKKPKYIITTPLPFWFCLNNGSAFPMIALEKQEIVLKIKFRPIEHCCYLDSPSETEDDPKLIEELEDHGHVRFNANIKADYIFLDDEERKRFAQSCHEYVINQLQINEFKTTKSGGVTLNLQYIHPSKEIIIVAHKKSRLENIDGLNSTLNWHNYGVYENELTNPVKSALFSFNGHDRIKSIDGSYFNYVQPLCHHTRTPKDGINVISFSLKPEEFQPSGNCDFSRIKNPVIYLKFHKDFNPDGEEVRIKVFCVGMNLLRVMSGLGGVAFVD
jgi:hypothetical protein